MDELVSRVLHRRDDTGENPRDEGRYALFPTGDGERNVTARLENDCLPTMRAKSTGRRYDVEPKNSTISSSRRRIAEHIRIWLMRKLKAEMKIDSPVPDSDIYTTSYSSSTSDPSFIEAVMRDCSDLGEGIEEALTCSVILHR